MFNIDFIDLLIKLFHFIAHSPAGWIAGIGIPIIGYAWTTKVANATTVAAEHINTLQTEKLDRDGAIPMTGPLIIGDTDFPADEIDGIYVVTENPITENVGRGGNFVCYYGGSYASTGVNSDAHVVGVENQNHCYGVQSWVFGDGSGTVDRAAGYMSTATLNGNVFTNWMGFYYAGTTINSGSIGNQWAFYADTRHCSTLGKTVFSSTASPTNAQIPYPVYAYDAFTLSGSALATAHVGAFSNTAAAVGKGGIIALGGESGAATTPYAFAFLLGAKEQAGATYNGYLAFYTTDTDSANSEKARVTSGGALLIAATAAVGTEKLRVDGEAYFDHLINAAGGQIQFPASQNASADANTLDDYEEGTFNPARNGFTEVPGAGSITDAGYYTKVGRVVNVLVTIIAADGATIAAVAGSSYISNLPFSAAVGASGTWGNYTAANAGGTVAVTGTAMYITTAWGAATNEWHLEATYHV